MRKRFVYYNSSGHSDPFFIFKVKTDNSGTSASNQYTFYIYSTANLDVDWGDSSTTTGMTSTTTHTYATAGTYTIKVLVNTSWTPRFGWGHPDPLKIIELVQWGTYKWGSFRWSFWGCNNLTYTATDIPDLSSYTDDYIDVFMYQCYSVDIPTLNSWDVSHFKNMADAFGHTAVNQYVGDWVFNSGLTSLNDVFGNSSMSTANYTDSIVAWANRIYVDGAPYSVDMGGQTGMTYDTSRSGGANFTNAGDARTWLTGTAGWTISGDTVI